MILVLLLFILFSPYLGFVKGDPSPSPEAILRISLPAGEDRTNISSLDPWLSQCWLLNVTGVSATFTVRINNTSGSVTSYDTHLIIALNNASYSYLLNLTVDTTTIPKNTFQYGTPKPYNLWNWPSGDVYPTWFNDTYVVGTIGPKNYTDVTVSVTFLNATGVRMHFDAYGSKVSPPPPTVPGEIIRNPLSGDSTVLFQPPVKYYLTVKTDPAGIVTIPGEGWYDNCTYVNLTAPVFVPNATGINGQRYRFDYWDVDDTSQGVNVTSITVHIDANHTATAHYILQYKVAFTQTGLSSDADGTVVTVDTVPKTFGDLPFSKWVDSGDSITYSYSNMVPSTETGKRFKLVDVTGPTSPITVTSPVTVIGNYKTQYYLTVKTKPAGLSPAPTPPSGWHDESTDVVLTAPDPSYLDAVEYLFKYWDVDGNPKLGNPITVHMNKPHTATAHYATRPVGGYIVPADKSYLLAPGISLVPPAGLASTFIAAMVAIIILIRRRKKTS
ncbi:MAG: hypothetical protein ACE5J6_01330 [Candidatus Bathyarchaeia archaeon]